METKWFFDSIPFYGYTYKESFQKPIKLENAGSKIENYSIISPKSILVVSGKYQQADLKNENDRIYSKPTLKNAIYSNVTKSKLEKRGMLGELEHPKDGVTQLYRVSHLVLSLDLRDDGEVSGQSEIFDTPNGLIIAELVRRNALFGISSRGKGTSYVSDGIEYVNEDFCLETFDFVYSPSTLGAYPKGVWQDAIKSESVNRDKKDFHNLNDLMSLSSRMSSLFNLVLMKKITDKGFSESVKEIEKKLSCIEKSDSTLERICNSIHEMILEAKKMPLDDKTTLQSSVASVIDAVKEDDVPEVAPNDLDKGWDSVKSEDDEDLPNDVAKVSEDETPEDVKKSERKKRWESIRNRIKKKNERKKSKKEDADPNVSIAAKDVAGVEEDDPDDNLEKNLPTDGTQLERLRTENRRLRQENIKLRKDSTATKKLAEGLTTRCRELKQANKTLALRYESSIDFASGLVERVEKARKTQYIKECCEKYPDLENLKSVLESCKNVSEVHSVVSKATKSLKENKKKFATENSVSVDALEKSAKNINEGKTTNPELVFASKMISTHKQWK